jgi:hypothetical protein
MEDLDPEYFRFPPGATCTVFELTNSTKRDTIISGMEPVGRTGKCSRLRVLLCGFVLALMTKTAFAVPPISTADPNCFFNTVASRLLSEELGMNLSAIPIYPTNQYTPAVHRLLQVTANIYDCTTTNYYPSVFRPIFWKTNELIGGVYQTNIYITGYQYVQEPLTNGEPIFSTPVDLGDPTIPFGLSGATNNIYGIPWVIGVKKGLPNFNALEMENCFFIERKLQFNRNTTTSSGGSFPFGRTYTTNQMYIMGISNILGIEFWNSYSNAFTNPVVIVAQDTFSLALTNDAGISINNDYSVTGISTTNVWGGVLSSSSYLLPLGTNYFLPEPLSSQFPSSDNLYFYYYSPNPINFFGETFTGPCFIPISLGTPNFPDAGTPPLPNFGVTITNRLQAYMIDANNCILDYVQLDGMNGSVSLNQAIADNSIGFQQGLWSTNFFQSGGNLPYGVYDQFVVSSIGGAIPVEDQDSGIWTINPIPGTTDTGPAAQQAFFSAFFNAQNRAPYSGAVGGFITNNAVSILAPYMPMRLAAQKMFYEANDPLVHYLTSDLEDYPDDTNSIAGHGSVSSLTLGVLNNRYMPWGRPGNLKPVGSFIPDNNPYNPSYKDPLVSQSDNWNFPTNEILNDTSWLGQVHRGTPWQTIFLKSTNILELIQSIPNGPSVETGLGTWLLWTGDLNAEDASNMAPVQDWHMASYLASLFETNYASLFSVNDANPGDWENLMNDMTALTNDLTDVAINSGFVTPQFATITVSSNSSQAVVMANAIESVRAAQPIQYFTNVGDIFAIPQLSDASPYLHTNTIQTQKGISDEAYEAIPAQLLPLLHADSIGSAATANGQRIIQFTGDDNHAYAVQVSCDLMHWTTISTNCPINGAFIITNTMTNSRQFYRTFLVQ